MRQQCEQISQVERRADPTGQPRPDHERVEVRVRSYRLKEPLPSLAFPTTPLSLRLCANIGPGRTFANVVVGM